MCSTPSRIEEADSAATAAVESGPDTSERKKMRLTRQAHPSVKEGTGPVCQREKGEEGRGGMAGWAAVGPSQGRKCKVVLERRRAGKQASAWAIGPKAWEGKKIRFHFSKPFSKPILNANSNQFEI